MSLQDDIVAKARSFINTPFLHQGRVPGLGMDCVGLIVVVAKELGLYCYDVPNYPRYSESGKQLIDEMLNFADIIPLEESTDGDIVIFWVNAQSKHPQHIGIKTDRGIVHTYDGICKMVETSMTDVWNKRLLFAFRFREKA